MIAAGTKHRPWPGWIYIHRMKRFLYDPRLEKSRVTLMHLHRRAVGTYTFVGGVLPPRFPFNRQNLRPRLSVIW